MASNHSSPVLFLLFLLLAPLSSASGRKVGGRAEVPGVAADKEVQELGSFSVAEHNRLFLRRHEVGAAVGILDFARVEAAQRQVVSGIKYYLRVAARDSAGVERAFDAVVVVKPWLGDRSLLSFSPAAQHGSERCVDQSLSQP